MSAVLQLSEFAIRPMQQIDITNIMLIETVAYTHPWTEGIFRDCLRVGYPAWVLEQNGILLGYALLSIVLDEAHILNLCIHPDYQRCGHGQRLLSHLFEIACQQHLKTMLLEVRASNTAAYRLYTMMGFIEVGIRKHYYPTDNIHIREHALILTKIL
ncbi:ribosomal protein S18-alanine N-acetyltransferase [Beggiatoa leptomitoformis]|uniref:[Ribosomal protein bS18]-alanine N-acetyltransferase n=1 Tax=Beggiatoa leptomitoformis TaxID=288004 RepID=A0A2N9YGZ7_9GAMM|nr:ribosomal protein S18-alanine N-acetyltransferase [Beggiatoa leptomitoformis]ALG67930.1 ribosomal protein S18-alanine N-acetyltransferase [Beggiatoa leptomitoformis]AUI69798.1 ribosomal protein S18-alanine N-acetyltransferase [Beggiatoa leptomitoformis]